MSTRQFNLHYEKLTDNFKISFLLDCLKINQNYEKKISILEYQKFFNKITQDVFQKDKHKIKLSKILVDVSTQLSEETTKYDPNQVLIFLEALIVNQAKFDVCFEKKSKDEYKKQKNYTTFVYDSFFIPLIIIHRFAERHKFELNFKLPYNHYSFYDLAKLYLDNMSKQYDLNTFKIKSFCNNDLHEPIFNVWSYFSQYFFDFNYEQNQLFSKTIIEHKNKWDVNIYGYNNFEASLLSNLSSEHTFLYYQMYPKEINSLGTSLLTEHEYHFSPVNRQEFDENQGFYKNIINLIFRKCSYQEILQVVNENPSFFTQENIDKYGLLDEILIGYGLEEKEKIELFNYLLNTFSLSYNMSQTTFYAVLSTLSNNLKKEMDFFDFMLEKNYLNLHKFDNKPKKSFLFSALSMYGNQDAFYSLTKENNQFFQIFLLSKLNYFFNTEKNIPIHFYVLSYFVNNCPAKFAKEYGQKIWNYLKENQQKYPNQKMDMSQMSLKGNNMLHFAFKMNVKESFIEILLEEKIPLTQKNKYGKRAYDYFLKYKEKNKYNDDDDFCINVEKLYLDELLSQSVQNKEIISQTKKI